MLEFTKPIVDINNPLEFFKLPLELDESMDIAWTADFKRAVDFNLSIKNSTGTCITRGTMKKMLERINDENHVPENNLNLKYDDGSIYMDDNTLLLTIRSWGRLTSDNDKNGCYGLSLEEAKIVQDNFGKFIISKLSKQ